MARIYFFIGCRYLAGSCYFKKLKKTVTREGTKNKEKRLSQPRFEPGRPRVEYLHPTTVPPVLAGYSPCFCTI